MTTPIPHLGNPDDQSLKEYIITLKDFDDSDGFYQDMEEPGGSIYIPKRVVECSNRLPISRNTHYMLTYDEAAEVMNDPRVLTVELNPTDLGFEKGTFGFEQYSVSFDKRVASDAADINWGLLRCLRKTDISNWGVTGTVQQTARIIADCTGKNVDVVIMDDGTPYPTVLEYQQNPDGTGYSRMVEFNWFQYNPDVTGTAAGNYSYSGNRLQQHGGHTTGTVAGNTQGWARDANIYNITYNDSIQYVRLFHRNKPVNPKTGVKNPTVMNNSWGYRGGAISPSSISQFTIRGVNYFPTSGVLGSYVWDSNIINNVARLNTTGAFPGRSTSTDADMIDAMNEGVIIVASAGNSYFYEDVPGGLDYDNTMIYGGISYYIHRGSSPGAAWGSGEGSRIICSGAVGQHDEASGASVYASSGIEIGDYKAEFSNYGPRIDCWAPGSGIQSVWVAGSSLYDSTNATDPRVAALGLTDTANNNFKKCPGTSMSGPQTTGVLACLAEKYPRMTQADARSYLKNVSPATILSTTGGAQDSKDAGVTFNPASNKQMLLLQGTRVPTADVGGFYATPFPESTSWCRPTTGQIYPRRRVVNSSNAPATFSLASNTATVNNGGVVTFTLTTTNVPNYTPVQYLVTAKPRTNVTPTLTSSAYSAVCTSNAPLAGTVLDTRPTTGNRILTTGLTTGTTTVITNNILGAASLTASTSSAPGALTFTGVEDDGYWRVPLPFNITYLSTSYSDVYIGTNTYITFGGGSTNYSGLDATNPALPKIMISCADNSCQRIYYGTEGSVPNRTFRIRYEGTNSTVGTLGSPNMVYEVIFYENNNAQIDVHTGVNARWAISTGNVYPFSYSNVNVPLVGTLTVTDNTASLPITMSTTDAITLTVRLGIYPTPAVNIAVN